MSGEFKFEIAGWVVPLIVDTSDVCWCGKNVGIMIVADEFGAGGVMDYHDVCKLRNILGEWLDRVEQDGSYKTVREERLQE